MKIVLLSICCLLLSACGLEVPSERRANVNGFKVEKLYTYEGCTVYRFSDVGHGVKYYANCTTGSATAVN